MKNKSEQDFINACNNNDIHTVESLIDFVNLEVIDEKGETAFIKAGLNKVNFKDLPQSYERIYNYEIVKLLINRGVNIDAQSKERNTVLLYAAHAGDIDLVDLLLEANMNHQDKRKMTSLMYAAYSTQDLVVEQLVSNGANLDLQDEDGNTALFWAFYKKDGDHYQRKNIIQQLIDSGANVSISNDLGNTAYNWAY